MTITRLFLLVLLLIISLLPLASGKQADLIGRLKPERAQHTVSVSVTFTEELPNDESNLLQPEKYYPHPETISHNSAAKSTGAGIQSFWDADNLASIALDALPIVGTVKSTQELVTGKD